MACCDLCGKPRKTMTVAVARLADDTQETIGVCFICDREGKRGRFFDRTSGAYVDGNEAVAREQAEAARWAARTDLTADEREALDIPF